MLMDVSGEERVRSSTSPSPEGRRRYQWKGHSGEDDGFSFVNMAGQALMVQAELYDLRESGVGGEGGRGVSNEFAL